MVSPITPDAAKLSSTPVARIETTTESEIFGILILCPRIALVIHLKGKVAEKDCSRTRQNAHNYLFIHGINSLKDFWCGGIAEISMIDKI